MGRDYVWVKHYLLDYGQQRAAAGYNVLHDSIISEFHEVLCTSMPGGVTLADDDRREAAAPAEADNGVDYQDQLVPDNAGDDIQPIIEEEDVPAPSGLDCSYHFMCSSAHSYLTCDLILAGPSQAKNAIEEQQQQDVRPRGRSRLSIQVSTAFLFLRTECPFSSIGATTCSMWHIKSANRVSSSQTTLYPNPRLGNCRFNTYFDLTSQKASCL